ncbi:MAG: alpha-glucan family phosphorylase [candidate division Zixibacteria bacterium]|nr:alpha-glucan family phosphorylase [candidate division Zixibacteria bacterium]
MRVKQLLVLPTVPDRLKPLQEMANNLWFSWNFDVVRLFIRLDPEMWEACYQNPIEMLSRLPQESLAKAAQDEAFLISLDRVYEKYKDYLSRKKWFHYKYPDMEDQRIAYFSLEYGLDTGLPVYSGGLGVLAGDTLKSASDLGLPLIGVGLLYRYGYFRQILSPDGWQQERYEENDWYHMPVDLVKNGKDEPLRVTVELDGMPVHCQIWKVTVGHIPLYLLDTNIPENSTKAREITSVLYGGDKDMRIRQEIILGIGGVRALKALGLNPGVYHMNEGHSWFLTLERLRILMHEKGLSFYEASQFVWATSVFTTHTPVPAGNERFDPVLVHRYLGDHIRQLGISWKDFLTFGRINPLDENETFCMTVAALKYSAHNNGVSQLHKHVSRDMWHHIWPGLPKEEIPITGITNGVHLSSWISHEMNDLFESYLGPHFTERPGAPEIWDKVSKVPDIELWRIHAKRRERLIFFARKRLSRQLEKRKSTQFEIQRVEQVLDPQVLTIGFARRFSTYKRGYLIFSDPDRLEKILNNSKTPVQIILAGKAHPLDNPGKDVIKKILGFLNQDRFRQRIIFLEDYDINVARYLVQGVDVWLNNPRRPEEASGTSGMKAAINGALNFSVLDGWWDEGYSEATGFKIGNGEEYENSDVGDRLEAESLYNTLEREIVPLFYERENRDYPEDWVARMKGSITMAGRSFSAARMSMEYTDRFYLPTMRANDALSADNYAGARNLTAWLERVQAAWDKVQIRDIDMPELGQAVSIGQKIPVRMRVFLDGIRPQDVRVEVVAGRLSSQEQLVNFVPVEARLNGQGSNPPTDNVYEYYGEVVCKESGRLGITARVVPRNEYLTDSPKPKLISWW